MEGKRMKKILVTIPVQECHKARIDELANGCSVTYAAAGTITEEQVAEASVIIGNVPAGMIKASEFFLIQRNRGDRNGCVNHDGVRKIVELLSLQGD